MAAMVASGNSQLSSPISVQEKGSRNKRKFRAEAPLTDPSKLDLVIDRTQTNSCSDQVSACDFCSMHQDQLNLFKSDLRQADMGFDQQREELDGEEFQDADWSDITETQLEELLLSNLDTIFRSAIKKIASYGYTEEIATKAVLRSGLCYGCKDTVSNIVDNTLAFLRNGQEVDTSREHFFEDLPQLERYILAEMVCVLKEVRPFFSTGDAMWCLLICDMNVSHACAMDAHTFTSVGNDDTSGNASTSTSNSESDRSATNTALLNLPKPGKQIPNFSSLPKTSTAAEGPNFPMPNNPILGDHLIFEGKLPQKESPAALQVPSEGHVAIGEECVSTLSMSHSSSSEEKLERFLTSKKNYTHSSKKESMLRQKTIHFEKSYRAYGAKSALKSGKLGALGSLVLDKKCKSISESTIASFKNASLKLSRTVSTETSEVDEKILNLSANLGAASDPGTCPRPTTGVASLPLANTDLTLSLDSKNHCAASNPHPIVDYASSSFNGISSDKVLGQWVPQDKKDEMILKLMPRAAELKAQLHEWTEWAQQKVMQAARRLSKDKAELKTLRQEKEEVARLKKEKQTLQENTMKKLSEMENALCKASGQVERANAAVRRLEVENAQLRHEMEAAKLRATESAANCQEVTKREIKTLKKFQSWESQKLFCQEELVTEKRKLSQVQQQLEQAKVLQSQFEARLRQEEKVKNDALTQADLERREREQIESSAKSKEDTIRLKAETDLERFKDEIRRLENEIAQLRLKTDSSKIAALKWGLDGSYVCCISDGRNGINRKETKAHYMPEIAYFHDTGYGDIQRERECVMCLTEEMSVVFLPCAHQVVCNKCNELHERQGMKECPSCRTPIQRRICVRWANC